MSLDYAKLAKEPRLLIEAELKPLQGHRFQPTGFADLGPARYTLADADRTEMLLVESAQSVANRMEIATCDDDKRTLLPELNGLPYVASKHKGEILTTSYLEAHRLSSPYLLNDDWAKRLSDALGLRDDFSLNDSKIATAFFRFDPCSLLHGVWLALEQYKTFFSGGRVRVTRALSGFIEATNVKVAENGGTKFDRNAARTEENANAKTGYGTLPYHRTEFTSPAIKAYFNLDLALLRGYRLDDDATQLLIALALLKVRRFLSHGLRLRTACDLEVDGDIVVKRVKDFAIPETPVLLAECKRLIAECEKKGLFATPTVTEILWTPPQQKSVKVPLPLGTTEPTIPEDSMELMKLKSGTKKKGPIIEFPKGLDATLVERAKSLFPDNPAVYEALDKALESLNVNDESTADESTDGTGDDQ